MPATVARTPQEEKLGKHAKDASRARRRRNQRRRLVLTRTRETEAGVAMNPQDRDGPADDLLTERGVIAPEDRPMESVTDRPEPGMLRVYDSHGRKTNRIANPMSNPKPMVLSQRARGNSSAEPPLTKSGHLVVAKSQLSEGLRQRVADGTAHWVTVTDEDSPLHGRHLLIGGPRPEHGTHSHGPILAGHGIPAHVIEKITGATRAEQVEHTMSDGPETVSAKLFPRSGRIYAGLHERIAHASTADLGDARAELNRRSSDLTSAHYNQLQQEIKARKQVLAADPARDPTVGPRPDGPQAPPSFVQSQRLHTRLQARFKEATRADLEAAHAELARHAADLTPEHYADLQQELEARRQAFATDPAAITRRLREAYRRMPTDRAKHALLAWHATPGGTDEPFAPTEAPLEFGHPSWRERALPKGWTFVGHVQEGPDGRIWEQYEVPTPWGRAPLYARPKWAGLADWQITIGPVEATQTGDIAAAARQLNAMGAALAQTDIIDRPLDPAFQAAQKKAQAAAERRQAKVDAHTTATRSAIQEAIQEFVGLPMGTIDLLDTKITPAEAHRTARQAAEGFRVVAQVLNFGKIPPVNVRLGKTLGRTHALAYYQPSAHSMNFGSEVGMEPFAHEFGHALEYGIYATMQDAPRENSNMPRNHPFKAFVRDLLKQSEAHREWVNRTPYARTNSKYYQNDTETFARFFNCWLPWKCAREGIAIPPYLYQDRPDLEQYSPHDLETLDREFMAVLRTTDLAKAWRAMMSAMDGLRKSRDLPAGQHWVTITKAGPLEGRHILLDGEGRIQGGGVPKFFHGKPLSEIHGKHLRRHWNEHAAMVRAAETHLRKLEREIGPLAKEYARMHRESQGPSLAQRIRQVTGGHLISSHPRHVGDLTGEFRETVPSHLKRKMGGVPIDQVAESLEMSVSDLLEGLRTPPAARQTIRDFTEMARHDVRHGDEYRIMQEYLEALKEEAGAYQGPARKPRKPVTKSRARDPRGVFIRAQGSAHRLQGSNPNPRKRMKGNRPRPGALPKEGGNPLGSPMQESSMQVLAAITQSKRRNPHPDWGFDPAANLPGNTKTPKPVGKPGIFVYKSEPAIRDALHDYAALIDAGKGAAVALHQVSGKYPWAQEFDTTRGRDWWAAVRRANLPRPRAYTGLDTEVDDDHEDGGRPKKAVFWREGLANLGQGIMAPTGSGGAGR